MKPLIYILLITTFSFSNVLQVNGQEKVDLSAGFGIPELLNVGVRYQLNNQVQLGFSVGSVPTENENAISIVGDVRYHFGGHSKLSSRRPWYGRVGLNYLRDETDYKINNYLYFISRLGKEFNISNRMGIEIDAGAIFELNKDEVRKKPSSGWDLNLDFLVLPSFGIGLFYRF